MNKYDIGTKLFIKNGGIGAMNANGFIGTVTDEIQKNGLLDDECGFNVLIDNDIYNKQSVWRVSSVGEYIVVSDDLAKIINIINQGNCESFKIKFKYNKLTLNIL